MLIPLADIILLYEKIIALMNISQISVIIFTSLDVDSVCTLKIISKLLQSQSVYYQVYPVSSYAEFNNKIQDTKDYKDVKLFFFINCGGIIDLTEQWFIDSADIFLFDTNKPIHHKNIQHPKVFPSQQQIKVIDDPKADFKYLPTSQDFKMLDQLEQYEFDQEQDQYEEQHQSQSSPKRKSNYNIIKQIKKKKVALQSKISNYYGRQYFSTPSSFIAYLLVKDMNKLSNDFLWYGIVGVTGMYLQQRLSKEILDHINNIYRQDMIKLNPQSDINRRQKGTIGSSLDFQFTLMRHWSLYQSMMNSNYVIIKLHLWKEQGREKLAELLTLIGISLAEAQQLYKYMSRQSKQKLKDSIFVYAQKFNLLDVAYHSFFRQRQYSSKLMASDYAYALINTLQKSQKTKVNLDKLVEHRVKNFWDAYQLLQDSQQKILQRIQEAKITSSIMSNQSRNIIERDHIIKGKSFYFVNINNDTDQRKKLQHPYTVIRLAYLLMGIQKQKKKKPLPFLVSLHDKDTNSCTVVGVMGQSRNSFGPKFSQVSKKLNINVKHDSFLANIMSLSKDNLLEFIAQLGNN